MQLALTLVLPFLACVALTLSVGPASFSLKWSLAMGILYIGQAALLRSLFIEQEFKVAYSSLRCIFLLLQKSPLAFYMHPLWQCHFSQLAAIQCYRVCSGEMRY